MPFSADDVVTPLSDSRNNPAVFIDTLLQDTYLFVMDIHHQPVLVRDEALYNRAVKLVEAVQATLNAMKAPADFIHHILYVQCAMIDDVILNTASSGDNYVWLHNPLQALFLGELRAGDVIPERIKVLLRDPVPDPRLLVLYQRLLAMEYGRLWHERYEEHARRASMLQQLESLNALIPEGEQPLSAPLVVERRPGVRGTLRHSRVAHITLALLVTAGLIIGLQYSLHHLLQTALPG